LTAKQKICLITHLFPYSSEDYKGVFVRDLAVELAHLGHEIHVVTPMRPGAIKEEIIEGVYVHRFSYYGWRDATQLGELKGTPILLLGSFILLGIFKGIVSVLRHDTDLIHAYWVVPGGFISLIVGWLTGRPVVVTAAGSDLTVAPQHRLVRLLTTLTLKRINRLLPVSNAMKEIALRLGLPGHKATVIHGPVGIDIQEFTKTDTRSSTDKKYSKCLLWVGNLAPPKRLDTIILAMSKVVEAHGNCHLVLIGEGNLRPSLETLAEKLGIQDHVHFRGAIPPDQISQVLQIADVFVHCSDHEGLGLAIMEAMGAGLPVVASRVGGVPDLVREGVTGFMVSPDDAEGYAQSILSLLEDDQLRNQLGTNGQSFAAKHLNKNTILSQLERVYQEVLNYKKRRFGRQFSS